MKNPFGILIAVGLILIVSTSSFGAVHPYGMADTDTWYSIEPDSPFAEFFYLRPNTDTNTYIVLGQFYQNDQTFFAPEYHSSDPQSLTEVEGSYLFDFGLFMGLDYQNLNITPLGSGSSLQISPGYRWNLDDKNNYVAVSFDYITSNPPGPSPSGSKIASYDLDAKYYTDSMKLTGEAVFLNDSTGNVRVDLAGVWKLNDAMTVGGELYSSSSIYYGAEVGLTYAQEFYIIDAKTGVKYNQPMSTDASFMYHIANGFFVGGEGDYPGTGDVGFTLKAKYQGENSRLLFAWAFPNSGMNFSSFELGYVVTF